MKKNILLLLAIFLASVASYAQQATATLNHNDAISTFYGIDALIDAHNKAVAGDVITLSSGQFNALTITTNNLTIIGAGMDGDTIRMEPDSSKWVLPTIIVGNLRFGTSVNHFSNRVITFRNLIIECLDIYNSYYNPYNGPDIIAERCFFKGYTNSLSSSYWINYTLYNCSGKFANVGRINAVNSYVQLEYLSTSCIEGVYTNCVVQVTNSVFCKIINSTLCNCIVLDSKTTEKAFDSSVLCQNTLYVGDETDAFKDVINVFGWSTTDFNIFKQGTYYELIEDIAQKYLGTDGTEIGMYGGAHIFTPTPVGPHITRCDVSPKTTPDGKLSVHIEVGGAQ